MRINDADKSVLDSFFLIYQLMNTHYRVSMTFDKVKLRYIQVPHNEEALVKGFLKQIPQIKRSVYVIFYLKNSSWRTSQHPPYFLCISFNKL